MKSLHTIKHRKNPAVLPIAATALAGLIIAGVGVWYFFFNKPATPLPASATANGINYAPPTEEEKQATNDKKDEIIKQQEEPTATDTSLSVSISRSFQEAGTVQLRTVVTGTADGDCIATFTKTGQPTVTKTFAVGFEATSASCQAASVPVSEFGASGSWNLSLVVKKDNKQSAATTAGIDITK